MGYGGLADLMNIYSTTTASSTSSAVTFEPLWKPWQLQQEWYQVQQQLQQLQQLAPPPVVASAPPQEPEEVAWLRRRVNEVMWR